MAHDTEPGETRFMRGFSDPDAVARYHDGPRRFVPGLDALHRMTGILLAEHVPQDGHVLVLGAGGGLELRALAEAHPGWRFTGVDPARPMLDLARETMGPLGARVEWVEGLINDAPSGPFDGAVCLLTLHFLPPAEREETLRSLHDRLKPGGPLVAAHGSFPQAEQARGLWLERYKAYALASGVEQAMAKSARSSVEAALATLDPAHDEMLLRQAGFADAALFFAAFTWRGWIGHA